jgi:hypothetical protein
MCSKYKQFIGEDGKYMNRGAARFSTAKRRHRDQKPGAGNPRKAKQKMSLQAAGIDTAAPGTQPVAWNVPIHS